MIVCESLKEKIIIIAENDEHIVSEIRAKLREYGITNIRIALDGNKLYEILRSNYNKSEQVGLLILNEDLPQCQLVEVCQALSGNENSSTIPLIVLSPNQHDIKNLQNELSRELLNKCLIHYLSIPVSYSELLIVVEFQLSLMHERSLRHKQGERLINERAERKVLDSKIKYLVAHDELTSLLSRQNFERQLRLILNRNRMLHRHGILLFFDIDRFSLINEVEGFETGDKLLLEIVSIIRQIVNKTGLFARIGSDEFCLFLENKTEKEGRQFAETARKAVDEFRFYTGDTCYGISISIGISSLNTKRVIYHPGELIARAQMACNLAKENGRNRIWEYNENDIKIQERHRDFHWVPIIKKALVEGNFFLVFQPIVDLKTGEISHYEVLARIREGHDIILASDFIPTAERMGLIHSIDLLVVDKAIDFLAEFQNLSTVSVSINLSGAAFQNETLLPAIKEKLDLTWVDPRRITFEITETAAVDNFKQTRTMIKKLRALGCKFALDDFGAGFCSFNYLKTFPVDYVKIDGQFIQNLVNNETDQAIVKSIVEIVTKLGKKTIAEFVETPETIELLRKMGINFGQGYVFGKPEINLLPGDKILMTELMHESSAI